MIRLALTPSWIPIASFDLRSATPVLPIAIGRPPSRSIPKQAFQQTAGAEIPIASDAPPHHTSRGFLVWGFFCQGFRKAAHLLSFVSFFVRSKSPFLRPDPRLADVVARRSCQGWPSHQPFPTSSAVARPHLDSFEHDSTFGAIGMTIRGEPAFGRGSVAPQPCIRWVQGPEP